MIKKNLIFVFAIIFLSLSSVFLVSANNSSINQSSLNEEEAEDINIWSGIIDTIKDNIFVLLIVFFVGLAVFSPKIIKVHKGKNKPIIYPIIIGVFLFLSISGVSAYQWNASYNNGLLHAWNFDEGSGDTVQDFISGANGTLTSTDTMDWINGIVGTAVNMSDRPTFPYINITDEAQFDGLFSSDNPFSVSLWTFSESVTAATVIFGKGHNEPNGFFYIGPGKTIANKIAVYFEGSDNGRFLTETSTSEFTDDVWTHIVVTYNGSRNEAGAVKIYINSTEMATTTSEDWMNETFSTNESVKFFNGYDTLGVGNCYPGAVDETLIYNRILSQSEITALYNSHLSMPWTDDYIPPNITIDSPQNRSYPSLSIDFNITIQESSAIDTCWITLNDGIDNITMTNISTNAFNYTNISMQNISYTAKFYCNDTRGYTNDSESIDFYIDTTFPLLTIISPIGEYTSQTIPISIAANDTAGLSYCYFNVSTSGGAGYTINTEIVNCSDMETTISTNGDYFVYFFINDTAGNINITNTSITVTGISILDGVGGGGGGSRIISAITEIPEKVNLCAPIKEIVKEKWKVFILESNWPNFKDFFRSFFNKWLCDGAASIAPI